MPKISLRLHFHSRCNVEIGNCLNFYNCWYLSLLNVCSSCSLAVLPAQNPFSLKSTCHSSIKPQREKRRENIIAFQLYKLKSLNLILVELIGVVFLIVYRWRWQTCCWSRKEMRQTYWASKVCDKLYTFWRS